MTIGPRLVGRWVSGLPLLTKASLVSAYQLPNYGRSHVRQPLNWPLYPKRGTALSRSRVSESYRNEYGG